MQEEQKSTYWAILELFGHTTIAGQVTEINYGAVTFLSVNVPETRQQPTYTKLINPTAVYAINPVDEETAKRRAENLNKAPITAWEMDKMIDKHNQANRVALEANTAALTDIDEALEEEDEDRYF